VAGTLNGAGLAMLLFDLLTEDEERRRELVFDIPLTARRLERATRAMAEPDTNGYRSATSVGPPPPPPYVPPRRVTSCSGWSRAAADPIWWPIASLRNRTAAAVGRRARRRRARAQSARR